MSNENNATEANLAIINQVEAGLSALEKACEEVPDFSTPEGYARAKELRKPITKARTTGDKARLAATAGLRDQVKSINSMWADQILPRIEAMDGPLKAGIKAVDDEKARIEQEAAEKEQARIEGIEARIAEIKAAPSNAVTLDQVNAAIEFVASHRAAGTYEGFDEFREAARGVIENADIALSEKRTALLEQAAEAAKLAEQKAEQDRIAAEQQAKQDEIDAQLKAIEDAKAEQVRKEAQASREKELAAQAEKDKQTALEAAEAKRLADIEIAKLEAAQAERDKAAKAEADRVSKEEREAAEKAESERLAAMAPDADQLRSWLETIPAMKSKEGKLAAGKISSNVTAMIDALSAGKKKAKAA